MIPDSQTVSEIKHVAAKTAGKMALASIKLRRPGFRKPQRFDFKDYNTPHCLKITQKVAFESFLILAFSTNFCPIKTDLSGNTV